MLILRLWKMFFSYTIHLSILSRTEHLSTVNFTSHPLKAGIGSNLCHETDTQVRTMMKDGLYLSHGCEFPE